MSFDELVSQKLDYCDLLFSCSIEVPFHAVKKNNREIKRGRGGRPYIGKSDRLYSAESYLTIKLKEQMRIQRVQTINAPLWAIFIFNFKKDRFFTKSGEIRKKIPDLSNLYQLPEDCLQTAGVIGNDGQIWSHDLSRRRPAEKTSLDIFLLHFREDIAKGSILDSGF